MDDSRNGGSGTQIKYQYSAGEMTSQDRTRRHCSYHAFQTADLPKVSKRNWIKNLVAHWRKTTELLQNNLN